MKQFILIVVWLFFAAPVMTAMGNEKISLSLPDINGKVHTLSQYAGKWVVVNYWATSCSACLKEIPGLVAFYKRHQDRDVVLLGVDFEDIPVSWLKDFMDSVSMNYTVLRSDTSPDTPFGNLMVLPTTFIVSPTGELVVRQVGAVTAADLDAYFKRQTKAGQANAPATATDIKIR